MKKVPKRILEVADQLRAGKVPRKYRARAVLKWFGAARRGANVLSDIKTVLANLGLETQPSFDEANMGDLVRFMLSASLAGAQPQYAATPEQSSKQKPEETNNHGGGMESFAASDEQLDPDPDDEPPVSKPDDRPVTSQSSDWTISSLRDKLERGQLDLQPKFQREYVWNVRPELPSRFDRVAAVRNTNPAHLFRQGCGWTSRNDRRTTATYHFSELR